MSGDDRVAPSADPSRDGGVQQQNGGLHRLMRALFELTPWGLKRLIRLQGEELARVHTRTDGVEHRFDGVEHRVDGVEHRADGVDHRFDGVEHRVDAVEHRADGIEDRFGGVEDRFGGVEHRVDGVEHRAAAVENRLDALEEGLRQAQTDLADLRAQQLAKIESRLDAVESSLPDISAEAIRLRDRVVPAVVGRSDALLERLAAEIDELGSLVERMLRREPLPIAGESAIDEAKLASSLAEVQPALLEAFRGPEAEIRHRLDHYLQALAAAPPVLDLGCGRGELLLLLRETGVEAAGIEGDAAVADASRRRGLDVLEGDVLAVLESLPDASRGAVTAMHLFEHLEPETLLGVLAEIRRVLRPKGVLIAESPNPHSLRVGAALFWVDPTHRRPLMPETLELYLKTCGFEVDRRELHHPFPADQLFADAMAEILPNDDPEVAAVAAGLDRLARRLDDLVNGPRDFAIWATRPASDSG